MIQEKLNKLKPYFKGLKVADNYRIVEFNLKDTWLVEEDKFIELQQKPIKESSSILYSMFYSDKKSFDDIIDFVYEKVIKHNLELEQKEELLRAKVEELKRVFEDKSLNELNGLKFTTEDNSLKLGTNKKPTPPPSKMIKEGEDPRPQIQPEYLKDMDNKNKIKQNGSPKELSKNS
tara:strand:- start:6982 stop:7509 length:528 start_codon:yes stop_codon:yes gene_type:complete